MSAGMSLLHIAARVAARKYVLGSRSDVLNEVDATFNNMGVYPP